MFETIFEKMFQKIAMLETIVSLLTKATIETLVMTFTSGFFGFCIGLPIGICLYITRPQKIIASPYCYKFLSIAINIFRAVPFIILLVWLIPFTRFLVGTSIGLQAAIVPLTVAAAAFIARMVENALLGVPCGLVEAARAMGATPLQIITKVLLPEAMPALVNAATITLVALVGYSAMGGAVGAGGLGQVGYQYGYIGYNSTILNSVIGLLVILVCCIQVTGDKIAQAINHK